MSRKKDKKASAASIRFGTDGWRAVIADEFTFANVRAVSQATADYLNRTLRNRHRRGRVVVGYDTRFLSERFAETVACVFAANNIMATLSDRFSPTPAISFTVKDKKYDLGIVITASHNPHEFNGYKIKTATGGSADVGVTKAVERLLFKHPIKTIHFAEGLKKKSIVKEDIISGYIKFLRSYLGLQAIRNSKFKFRILMDSMYGSGDSYIKDVISDAGVDVKVMRDIRNPYFEGSSPEPVEKNLSEIMHRMRNENFDLGLVLDGDADRIAAVVRGGEFLHPQKILGLLALHLKEDRGFSGGIVKTLAGTTMIDHIAKHLDLQLYETPVGFKHISRLMEKEDILIGGEEAGGIGFKNYVPERDGTLAGLLLLEMMAYRNEAIGTIVAKMEESFGRYFYLRDAVKFKAGQKLKDTATIKPKKLLDSAVVEIKDFDGVKLICKDESWLMLRSSGTEPLVRIYCEAKSQEKALQLLALGKELVLK